MVRNLASGYDPFVSLDHSLDHWIIAHRIAKNPVGWPFSDSRRIRAPSEFVVLLITSDITNNNMQRCIGKSLTGRCGLIVAAMISNRTFKRNGIRGAFLDARHVHRCHSD